MKGWLTAIFCIIQFLGGFQTANAAEGNSAHTVYILPIHEEIMPPLVYLVRRGVKEAMDAKADTLILDMDTNGGRVDTTQEIIEILNQFKGKTVTYVNKKAFSAGAFISFATQKIYMAPQSVIGAAAPIMLSPTGSGPESMPDTMEVKMTSAVSALVRANAEKNGHNVEVADAMVKKTKELVIDGKTLNEKGNILTLTDKEASAEYGSPAKPLLSSGTFDSIDDLLKELGLGQQSNIVRVKATGAEMMAFWLNAISPLLLIIGVVAFYIEFKTPGFGLPGTVGIVAFTLYFLGGYIAGLSGIEWIVIFLLGLGFVIFELFIHPGTILPGLTGAALMFVAIIMALVDVYPGTPLWPLPSISQGSLRDSLRGFSISIVGSMVLMVALAKILPKTPLYGALVSNSVSGGKTEKEYDRRRSTHLGQVGVTISTLRPGGKAQFGEEVLDVISQGDMVQKGQQVKIVRFSGPEAVVEVV